MLRIRLEIPNHVHLILTPSEAHGLALALSRAHRLYSGFVNARTRRTGHVFQGRYGSVAMDEEHLLAAVRHVALNPVRARLVADARDWPHASVAAHLSGRDDGLVTAPLWPRRGCGGLLRAETAKARCNRAVRVISSPQIGFSASKSSS